MLENFEIFLEHDVKWKDANQSILIPVTRQIRRISPP